MTIKIATDPEVITYNSMGYNITFDGYKIL